MIAWWSSAAVGEKFNDAWIKDLERIAAYKKSFGAKSGTAFGTECAADEILAVCAKN